MTSAQHIKELKQQLQHRHPEVAELFAILNINDEQLTALENAVLRTDPNEFFASLKNAMQAFEHKFREHTANPLNTAQDNAALVELALNFVNIVAGISDEFKQQVRANHLEHITLHELLIDHEKQQNLMQLFTKMVLLENMQRLQVDFLHMLQQAVQEAVAAMQAQVERLKCTKLANMHDQGAEAEYDDITEKAIKSASDGAMFDKMRRLAHLLAFLWHHKFVVPIERELYPRAFKHSVVTPDQDSFLKFQRDRFPNSDVIDPGSAPVTAAANIPTPAGPPRT